MLKRFGQRLDNSGDGIWGLGFGTYGAVLTFLYREGWHEGARHVGVTARVAVIVDHLA